MEFQQLGRQGVIGGFDGGKLIADAGGVLLREVEKRTDILERLTGCFRDDRNEDRIEHEDRRLRIEKRRCDRHRR